MRDGIRIVRLYGINVVVENVLEGATGASLTERGESPVHLQSVPPAAKIC
jgi:hypothetical protein